MSQVAATISDFSTDELTDQGLYPCVSSDHPLYQDVLTEQQYSFSLPTRRVSSEDSSVDTDDMTDMPPWLMDVLPRLEELAALHENWDSYGSPPPTPEWMGGVLAIVQRAERLLGRQQRPIPTPSIVPLSGGGIQIEWQTPVKELELEFVKGRPPVALAVDIATGKTSEVVFEASDYDSVSALLAWLMSS